MKHYNTKLHEALDIFVPLHYNPNRYYMAFKPMAKFFKYVLAVLILLSVLIFGVLLIWLSWEYSLLFASVILVPTWAAAAWIQFQESRYDQQIDTIVDRVKSYTGLPFHRSHIEEFIGKVYIHQVVESVIQENE